MRSPNSRCITLARPTPGPTFLFQPGPARPVSSNTVQCTIRPSVQYTLRSVTVVCTILYCKCGLSTRTRLSVLFRFYSILFCSDETVDKTSGYGGSSENGVVTVATASCAALSRTVAAAVDTLVVSSAHTRDEIGVHKRHVFSRRFATD